MLDWSSRGTCPLGPSLKIHKAYLFPLCHFQGFLLPCKGFQNLLSSPKEALVIILFGLVWRSAIGTLCAKIRCLNSPYVYRSFACKGTTDRNGSLKYTYMFFGLTCFFVWCGGAFRKHCTQPSFSVENASCVFTQWIGSINHVHRGLSCQAYNEAVSPRTSHAFRRSCAKISAAAWHNPAMS